MRGKAQAAIGRAKRATSACRLPEPCQLEARKANGQGPELRGQISRTRSRRVTPLTNAELTQAFLAHEDQLNILQTQTAIVFKLPSDGAIGKALLASVQGWQRDHKPGQAHTRKVLAIKQSAQHFSMSLQNPSCRPASLRTTFSSSLRWPKS